jgi:hypothetical protein
LVPEAFVSVESGDWANSFKIEKIDKNTRGGAIRREQAGGPSSPVTENAGGDPGLVVGELEIREPRNGRSPVELEIQRALEIPAGKLHCEALGRLILGVDRKFDRTLS